MKKQGVFKYIAVAIAVFMIVVPAVIYILAAGAGNSAQTSHTYEREETVELETESIGEETTVGASAGLISNETERNSATATAPPQRAATQPAAPMQNTTAVTVKQTVPETAPKTTFAAATPAPPVMAPQTTAAASTVEPPLPVSSDAAGIAETVKLVNEIRVRYGLKVLAVNEKLASVAQKKAEDMVENHYFAHNSPTYGSPFDMMRSFGITYRTAGENLAMGYSTPDATVNGWMNSEGHRANILNGAFTQIGIGYAAEGNYYCQMFLG